MEEEDDVGDGVEDGVADGEEAWLIDLDKNESALFYTNINNTQCE